MKKNIKVLYAALLASIGLCSISSKSIAQVTYCPPAPGFDNTTDWITNVSFGGMNNSSVAASVDAYSDFTTTVSPGQLTVGTPGNLSVSFHSNPIFGNYYIYAYIDWNQNGVLDDAGEQYILGSGIAAGGTQMLSIVAPANALPGNTRMRIILDMANFTFGLPCNSIGFAIGEVEDYTLNIQAGIPVTSVSVATQGAAPASINTNAGTLQMTSTVLPAIATQTVNWSIVPVTGTATISAGGLITAQTNGTVWAKAVSVVDLTKKDSLLITLSNQVTVTGLTVSTQGNVPPTITTNAGTLQMVATVLPVTASQAVTWSIIPFSGTATVSASGLVTAQLDGTVWVKAVSNADPSKKDSMQLTLSNQTPPPTMLSVFPYGLVSPDITTNGGTLQMAVLVSPLGAGSAVTWSIIPVTGTATISATGLVTAQTDGTVWAKGVSIFDVTKKDSTLITISNQIPPVASVSVATQGSVPATITSNAGSLQMTATVLPATATQTVLWSIVPVTGAATISGSGLVAAQANGTVWARAVSTVDATKKDSMLITISNQVVPITSLVVATQGGVPATITGNAGSLQMTATVLPATAVQTVDWSLIPGTGTATISASGLVTAQTNGTVWAKAVSTADVTKMDSMLITISNQVVPITSLVVATQGGVPATITGNAGSLQMTATVLPATAVQTVDWSLIPGTGTATISASGLVTAQTNGTVWAKAVSTSDATKMDSMLITISNQVEPVASVTVATQGGVPTIITDLSVPLQMTATVLPATAVQTVDWSLIPGTGTATISASGLVTAQTNGTVWAKAVSTSDATKMDSLLITINGTGVQDLFTSGAVSVYPNPVSNELIISFDQKYTDGFELSVVNLLGPAGAGSISYPP